MAFTWSLHNWLEQAISFLRKYSPWVSFVIGFAIAIGGAVLWHKNKIGQIRGSLLIGIGSSAIAAGIVGFLSPFYEIAYRRFVSLGIQNSWPSRRAVRKRNWVDWLQAANEKCTLLGIAHGNWVLDERFEASLRDRLKHGVAVKILFLNPNSDSAELREREEGGLRKTRDVIRESIEWVWKFREGLEPAVRDRLRVFAYEATASCGLTWIDDYMIVTHYLAWTPDVTSPAIRLQPAQIGTGGLYDVYAETVEKIIENSTELDDRNFQEFLPAPGTDAVNLAQQKSDYEKIGSGRKSNADH
jgi:hypothetical protein